jgi:hypothetical protein
MDCPLTSAAVRLVGYRLTTCTSVLLTQTANWSSTRWQLTGGSCRRVVHCRPEIAACSRVSSHGKGIRSPWAGRVACWTNEPTLKMLGRDGSDQSGGRKEWRSLG